MSARYVTTSDSKAALKGREADVLDAIGINWRGGRSHITCPYPDHGGANDWRWDARKGRAYCTCIDGSHSALDVVMKVERLDFEKAKVRAAELLGRTDLIRNGAGETRRARSDAKRLLNPPSDQRDDRLPVAYLAYRLGVTEDDVPIPSTHVVGLKALGYYDSPKADGAKPTLVGTYPCAVFGTVAADGGRHAHRIYLAPGGVGKADLGVGPDGRPRDPKKSARIIGDDNTSGRSVLWGDPERALHIVVTEGIETGAAVALAMKAEVDAGELCIAAAICATGVEAFQPYPATRRVTIAADRDEASKPNGKSGSRRGENAARAFSLRHHETLDIAIALPGRPGESTDWLDVLRREGADAVRAGILAASPFAPTAAELDAPKLAKNRVPLIRVMGGDLADATAATLRVLADEPKPLAAVYVRGTLLVRAVRMRDRLTADGLRRPMDALSLRAVDADWLALRLAEIADWYKLANLRMKPVDPPERVCRSVLAAAPWPELPPLSGIIEAPTIRPDGSLLIEPGYDDATGLLFDPGDTRFPPIPNEPTRGQAEAALPTLAEPFKGFPFLDEASRSVALAAVLTMLVRRMLRAAPLFAFDAPKMASGKTLLATVPSYIATGRGPYLMAQVADPTDERKRLLAALLECPAAVVIDNIESTLRSEALCITLTEPTFTDRLLGASKMATVETNCCFFATGNNLTIAGDLSARALVCRIDPEIERPEEREFAVDLHSWVPAHRGELAAAALTIVRAYLAAGAPKPAVPNFARFEEWQRRCRYPLIWLGCADPCDSRKLIEQSDPVRESLRTLLAAWHAQFKNGQTTVNEAIKAATEGTDLQCAMDAIAGEKGGINARRLGRFISRHERRIEDGLRFEKGNKHGGATRWLAKSDQFVKFDQFPHGHSHENGFPREVGGKKQFHQTGMGQTAKTYQTDHGATLSEVDL